MLILVRRMVLTRADFALRGHRTGLKTFWLSELRGGRECFWHILGRGWTCCGRSCNAQDRPHRKVLVPDGTSAGVEKPELEEHYVLLALLGTVTLPRSRVSVTNQVMRWLGTDMHIGNMSLSVMSKSLLISKSIRIDLYRRGKNTVLSLPSNWISSYPGGKKRAPHCCLVMP